MSKPSRPMLIKNIAALILLDTAHSTAAYGKNKTRGKAMILKKSSMAGLLGACCLLGATYCIGQADSIDDLLIRLRSNATPSVTASEIIERGRANASERDDLSKILPVILTEDENKNVSMNEIQIAKELRLTSCLPALVSLYLRPQVGGVVLLGRIESLADSPAGQALVALGDDSVPAMQHLLESSDVEQRRKAVRVLVKIQSPKAKDVLSKHLAIEKNQSIRHKIEVYEGSNKGVPSTINASDGDPK